MQQLRSMRWMIFFLVFVSVALMGGPVYGKDEAAHSSPRRVLVLNSYHQGYQWADSVMRGVQEVFHQHYPHSELLIENYDTKRNSPGNDEYRLAFRDLLKAKYKSNPVDVIIATDDNAFDFLAQYRDEIFGPKPLLFSGVNNPELPKRYQATLTNFDGVLQVSDEENTIRLALQLHPNAKQVYLFSGKTKTGQAYRGHVERAMLKIQKDVPALEWKHIDGNYTHEEVDTLVPTLPRDSIGILTNFVVDRNLAYRSAEKRHKEIILAAPFPVYCLTETVVLSGAVGGQVARGYDHGAQAARMAIAVLKGTPLAPKKTWGKLENTYLFCYDQLQRWGVSHEALPKGSVVRNLPLPTLWERYWYVICAGILGLILEAIIIISLIVSRRRLARASREIEEKELRYRHMFEFSNDARGLIRLSGEFVDCNQNMISLLGATGREGLLGKHPVDITYDPQGNPKETRQRVDALDALAAEQDVPPFEWTLKRLDTGEKVEVLVRLGAIDVQGEVFIQVVAHDMTEEYRMMRTLRESEENLRITLESIGDAVIATDTNGCVSRMNQIALDLTGWDLDDAKGQPLEEVFHIINCDSRKRVDNPVALVLATGQIQGLANHTVLISKRGTEYHIADSAAPIRNDDGEILGVVMVFQDVTEQHLLQERLNHSQKMESIGQLAGGVAHDFNNILAGIMGHAELLVNEIPKESMPQSYLSSIISSCDRAADLVSQLLNFARKGKILSSAIDLHEIISESEQLLRTTMDKSISIRSDLTASVSSVVGDPTQLQSMILNLAINARDVMPHGGEFVIHTENITLNEAYCRISEFDVAPGDYLLLSVRDTGCGISAEVLPHIFDPFFTTKPTGEGTGLGLASIHGVVTSHHGAICVYSEEGTGSEFHIYLPVSDNAVPIAPVVHPGEPKGGGETILLIDDEPMIRNMAWSILSDMGYTVLLAENGRRGVELYRDNIETIDLVVLDMIMPVLSGRETFGELHEINPAVKVVMASGFAHDDRIEEMLSLGAKQFVRKPFRIGQFAYALRAALDEE